MKCRRLWRAMKSARIGGRRGKRGKTITTNDFRRMGGGVPKALSPLSGGSTKRVASARKEKKGEGDQSSFAREGGSQTFLLSSSRKGMCEFVYSLHAEKGGKRSKKGGRGHGKRAEDCLGLKREGKSKVLANPSARFIVRAQKEKRQVRVVGRNIEFAPSRRAYAPPRFWRRAKCGEEEKLGVEHLDSDSRRGKVEKKK